MENLLNEMKKTFAEYLETDRYNSVDVSLTTYKNDIELSYNLYGVPKGQLRYVLSHGSSFSEALLDFEKQSKIC